MSKQPELPTTKLMLSPADIEGLLATVETVPGLEARVLPFGTPDERDETVNTHLATLSRQTEERGLGFDEAAAVHVIHTAYSVGGGVVFLARVTVAE